MDPNETLRGDHNQTFRTRDDAARGERKLAAEYREET